MAAHVRRTDFLWARRGTTPEVKEVAAALREVALQRGLHQAFMSAHLHN